MGLYFYFAYFMIFIWSQDRSDFVFNNTTHMIPGMFCQGNVTKHVIWIISFLCVWRMFGAQLSYRMILVKLKRLLVFGLGGEGTSAFFKSRCYNLNDYNLFLFKKNQHIFVEYT